MTGPHGARWRLSSLGPMALAATVAMGLLAFPVGALAGCAAHEIGHGLAGTALGYEVERIRLCPGDAGVAWAPSPLPPIDATFEAWAGGLFAGILLLAVYAALAWRRTPYRSPIAWSLGFALASLGAGELLIGILEGSAQGLESQLFATHPLVFYPLVLAVLLGAALAHLVAWRAVLR